MFKFRLERFIDINLETNQAYLYLDDKPLIEVTQTGLCGLREILLSRSSYIKPFTARNISDSGDFWYAYRKVGGKLRNAYLGKSDRLRCRENAGDSRAVRQRLCTKGTKKLRPSIDNGYAQEYITRSGGRP